MSHKITPSTSLEAIRKRLRRGDAEKLRESEQRRSYLQRVAKWLGGARVKIEYVPEQASAQKLPDEAYDDYLIRIPTERCEQLKTNLPEKVWDLLFQETELMHELGHVLYTRFGYFEAVMNNYDFSGMREKKMFKCCFNAVEDGAIERQLAAQFNVGDDLYIKNENLMNRQSDERDDLKMYQAINGALLDLAKHDTGRLARTLDPDDDGWQFEDDEDAELFREEVVPLLKEMVEAVVTEPNGKKRVDVYTELWPDIAEYMHFPDSPTNNEMESNLPGGGGDGIPLSIPGENAGDGEGEDADELGGDGDGDESERLERVVSGAPAGDGEGDGEDGGEEGGAGAGAMPTDDDAEERVKQKYRNEVRREEEEEGDDELTKAGEEMVQALQSLKNNSGRETEVEVPDDHSWWSEERYIKAKQRSRVLTKAFESQLQHERESDTSYNQLSGRIDTSAMMKANRGNTRIFKAERDPDEKDYSVSIVLDRTGSMRGREPPFGKYNCIEPAEEAAASLAMALRNVGVEVEILGMPATPLSLELPFGGDVDEYKKRIFTGKCPGGYTPLHEAIAVARERLNQRDGEKFTIVITDGIPSNEKGYREELGKFTNPVIGVLVGPQVPDDAIDASLYHRMAYVEDPAELGGRLKSLVDTLIL